MSDKVTIEISREAAKELAKLKCRSSSHLADACRAALKPDAQYRVTISEIYAQTDIVGEPSECLATVAEFDLTREQVEFHAGETGEGDYREEDEDRGYEQLNIACRKSLDADT